MPLANTGQNVRKPLWRLGFRLLAKRPETTCFRGESAKVLQHSKTNDHFGSLATNCLDFSRLPGYHAEEIFSVFSPAFLPVFFGVLGASKAQFNTEVYRSGHNGPDSKSGKPAKNRSVGSNPTASATPVSLRKSAWKLVFYWIAVSAPFRPLTIASAEDSLEL